MLERAKEMGFKPRNSDMNAEEVEVQEGPKSKK
jgi:hypothetical protein